MHFEPKYFMGLVDFLSILLRGTLSTYFLLHEAGLVQPKEWNDRLLAPNPGALRIRP